MLLGWALDIPILKSLLPGYAAMKPWTAICFVLCGVALALHASGPTGIARLTAGSLAAPITAALAGIISLASIVEFALHLDVIDEVLFHQNDAGGLHIPKPS